MPLSQYELDVKNQVRNNIKDKFSTKKIFSDAENITKKYSGLQTEYQQKLSQVNNIISKRDSILKQYEAKVEQVKDDNQRIVNSLTKIGEDAQTVQEVGNPTFPMPDAKVVLAQAINYSLQKWQKSSFGGGSDTGNNLKASSDALKILSADLTDAITSYITSLYMNILPRTIVTTPAGPGTVVPSNNHGFILETAPVFAFPGELIVLGGRPVAINPISIPQNRV